MKIGKATINIQPDLQSVSAKAAEEFVKLANLAIAEDGRFTVVLSGGATPIELYKLLATEEFCSRIDWEKVFFFFSDERDVSPASAQSNFKLVNDLLFKPLKIAKSQIYRWQTEIINAVGVANQYEAYIRKFFKLAAEEFPRFDLVLLGMGEDGHTASLFPRTKALSEDKAISVANQVKQIKAIRLTLTFPVINNAANVIFIVSGENKAKTLQAVLTGDFEPEKLPAQSVKPSNGKLTWIIDEDAGEHLKK